MGVIANVQGIVMVNKSLYWILYVTGFVKIDPSHTGTEIHFIAEH